MRQDNLISYADLELLGWPQHLINDYQGIKRELTPQSGEDADPNNLYVSNLNGFYIDTLTPRQWFNPTTGSITGWIAL